MAVRTPAVFLDKDGTLVEDLPYNVDPQRVRLAPDAVASLARLQAQGYRLAVISNQSGVARGRFGERALRTLERHLRDRFAQAGVTLSGVYWCPHHPDGVVPRYAIECTCRKPRPGLLWRAARDLEVDLTRSWMIGDILDDVEAGRRAGCRTVLLDNGHETEWQLTPLRLPHAVVPSLTRAVDVILDAVQGASQVAGAGPLPRARHLCRAEDGAGSAHHQGDTQPRTTHHHHEVTGCKPI